MQRLRKEFASLIPHGAVPIVLGTVLISVTINMVQDYKPLPPVYIPLCIGIFLIGWGARSIFK